MSKSGPFEASATPDLSGQVVIVTGGARDRSRNRHRVPRGRGGRDDLRRSEPEAVPAVDGRAATFVAADVREPDISETVRRSGRADCEQRRRLAPG
jgi:hypothetical protein